MNMNTEPGLKVLISKHKIAATIRRLSDEIRQDYQDKNPLLVGILKGSFIFMSDLVRQLDIPLEVDFIRLSSYGSGTQSSGQITLIHELPSRIQDRHVLVVEDIVDTGLTTTFLCNYIRQKGPASLINLPDEKSQLTLIISDSACPTCLLWAMALILMKNTATFPIFAL
jgi:hypoxanthine phosphoribosyltransferase